IKNPQTPLTLVLGSESLGIREETLEHRTHRVTIPMENTESLNVAIAGAIMMHHFQLKKG
ncbi:MAG: TrmH family RNA methyltransferase, partial [Candidatus Izemoplasmatales bacterium]